jgi:PRTRC genetic system protein A
MNDFDKAIAEAFPLVAAPKKEPLDARVGSGIRYVVGSNGLAREVMLPFMRVVHMVSGFGPKVNLPYGAVEPVAEMWFEGIPRELIREFKQAAIDALPTRLPVRSSGMSAATTSVLPNERRLSPMAATSRTVK